MNIFLKVTVTNVSNQFWWPPKRSGSGKGRRPLHKAKVIKPREWEEGFPGGSRVIVPYAARHLFPAINYKRS